MGNLQSEFRVKANLIFQKVNFGPRATVYESKLVKKPKKNIHYEATPISPLTSTTRTTTNPTVI